MPTRQFQAKMCLWFMAGVVCVCFTQVTLQKSDAVTVSRNNAVVENLHITVSGTNGVTVNSASNVTIRNCKIDFSGNCRGIYFSNAKGLLVEYCDITYTNAPARGPLPATDRNAIEGEDSHSITIRHVRVRDASTGVYLRRCDSANIQYLEGYNMRGPFPRGQLVQWDNSRGGLLEDFSVYNDSAIAWTEDNINCYRSGGQVIRRGLINGNNSPSGVGILFEEQAISGFFGGTVEDVDLIAMGNGVCSGCQGARDITFTRIRAKNNICTDLGQSRGAPLSNALVFSGWGDAAHGLGTNLKVVQATLYNLCNPGNIFWPDESFTTKDYTIANFTPRNAIVNIFPWETHSATEQKSCTKKVAEFMVTGTSRNAIQFRLNSAEGPFPFALRIFHTSGRSVATCEGTANGPVTLPCLQTIAASPASGSYKAILTVGTRTLQANFMIVN